jgi:hypothetical protein
MANEFPEGGEEVIALKKFEESGRFAAGDDEAVDGSEFFGLADEDGFGPGLAQGLGVGVVVALDGEYSYAGWGRRDVFLIRYGPLLT